LSGSIDEILSVNDDPSVVADEDDPGRTELILSMIVDPIELMPEEDEESVFVVVESAGIVVESVERGDNLISPAASRLRLISSFLLSLPLTLVLSVSSAVLLSVLCLLSS